MSNKREAGRPLSPRLRSILRGATTRATTSYSNNGLRKPSDRPRPVTLPTTTPKGPSNERQ